MATENNLLYGGAVSIVHQGKDSSGALQESCEEACNASATGYLRYVIACLKDKLCSPIVDLLLGSSPAVGCSTTTALSNEEQPGTSSM
jgi:hypothetical protein